MGASRGSRFRMTDCSTLISRLCTLHSCIVESVHKAAGQSTAHAKVCSRAHVLLYCNLQASWIHIQRSVLSARSTRVANLFELQVFIGSIVNFAMTRVDYGKGDMHTVAQTMYTV